MTFYSSWTEAREVKEVEEVKEVPGEIVVVTRGLRQRGGGQGRAKNTITRWKVHRLEPGVWGTRLKRALYTPHKLAKSRSRLRTGFKRDICEIKPNFWACGTSFLQLRTYV